MIEVKTIRWQCSGCDHLCAMLVDQDISPETLTVCTNSKWRIEENPDKAEIERLKKELEWCKKEYRYVSQQGSDYGQ